MPQVRGTRRSFASSRRELSGGAPRKRLRGETLPSVARSALHGWHQHATGARQSCGSVALVTGAAGAVARGARLAEGRGALCVDVRLGRARRRQKPRAWRGGRPRSAIRRRAPGRRHGRGLHRALRPHRRCATWVGILRFDHTHQPDRGLEPRAHGQPVRHALLLRRGAAPHLIASKGQYRERVASTAALKAQPWSAAYSASKGGICRERKSATLRAANGAANAVCPRHQDADRQRVPPAGGRPEVA